MKEFLCAMGVGALMTGAVRGQRQCRIAHTLSVVILLFATGCSTTEQATSTDGSVGGNNECFYVRDIETWSVIDRSHLHIEASRDTHFLLTLMGVCPGIENALALAIEPANRVCVGDSGRVRYNYLRTRATCSFNDVESVEDLADADRLVQERKAEE